MRINNISLIILIHMFCGVVRFRLGGKTEKKKEKKNGWVVIGGCEIQLHLGRQTFLYQLHRVVDIKRKIHGVCLSRL